MNFNHAIYLDNKWPIKLVHICIDDQSNYRHSSIYAVNVGTQKKCEKQNTRKSRLLSSTKGEENRIEI